MKPLRLISPFCLLAVLLSSCNNSNEHRQTATGKAGEVIVVISKSDWESDAGGAVRDILASEYPLLPQSEPKFTLINIPQSAFTNIFQLHRNILTVTIDSGEEAQLISHENVWAKPQTVISITAPNQQSATNLIKQSSERMTNIYEQAERSRIIQGYKNIEEPNLRELVNAHFGGSPYFPQGYSLKKQTDNLLWISYETIYINQGIFIYKYPYSADKPLTLRNIILKRDEILRENIEGTEKDSYMTTTKDQLDFQPKLSWIKYRDRNFAEVRGLWELVNGFMGGPFVCHSFYDNDGNVIVLEAFVYSPKYDKRNYLRQVESIIYSFEWDNKVQQDKN